MKRMKREEVFEYLDPKWKWIAMDWSGMWSVYTLEPIRNSNYWYPCTYTGPKEGLLLTIDYNGPWEDSLMERPRKSVRYYIGEHSIALYYLEHLDDRNDSVLPAEAPPEVADWFHRIMEESK